MHRYGFVVWLLYYCVYDMFILFHIFITSPNNVYTLDILNDIDFIYPYENPTQPFPHVGSRSIPLILAVLGHLYHPPNQPTTNNPHTYTPQTAPIRTRHITAHVRRPPPQSVRLRRYLGQLVTRKSGIISPRPSARTSTCGRSSQRYVDFELRFARSKTTAHRD